MVLFWTFFFIILCFILDILFFFFFFFFHINPHIGKFRTDPVAAFKSLRVFSWSPSNQKLLTPSKIYTSKKCYSSIMVNNRIKGPCGILVGGLCGKGWRLQLLVTVKRDLVLDVAGVLYPWLSIYICWILSVFMIELN